MVTSNTDMNGVKHIRTVWSCIWETYLRKESKQYVTNLTKQI